MAGLYFHIPFCRSKCPYCDFYSVVAAEQDLNRYVQALCLDLKQSRDWYGSAPFSTVFFGGGTPSLLSGEQIATLLQCASCHYGLCDDAEVSMEVNPGTVDVATLESYRQAGVNRLSIGVQSLDDHQLRWLQRPHSAQQAVDVVHAARQAGFSRINVDLMFALPGQSDEDLRQSCRRLAELSPEHVAVYGLTVEEGTPLASAEQHGDWQPVDDDTYCRHFQLVSEELTSLGFEHYEISNFARPGEACRHNLGYWQRQPYLGIGAGAHSFRACGWGERWSCPDDIRRYLVLAEEGTSTRQCIETFNHDQAISEAVYLALRCRQGVDLELFQQRYGVDFCEYFAEAIRACGHDLSRNGNRCSFNLQGWLLYNSHIENFLL